MLFRSLTALAAALTLVASAGCRDSRRDPVEPDPPAPPPLGLVLVVGDGIGEGALDAARRVSGPLAMERLPVRGAVETSSASHRITDSGAAATALATGASTYNGAVGVGPDSLPVETLLEAAEERGMATGLVSTSSVTHATPAAFAAHVASRSWQEVIAAQMAEAGMEVLLGGGASFFRAEDREDGVDRLAPFRARGCATLAAAAALPEVEAAPPACLVGLFAEEALAEVGVRSPSLLEMVEAGVEILLEDPDGFVLMVEGSQIDWAAHANDGPRTAAETAELDAVVQSLLTRLDGRENTVLVVTADHETGGLALAEEAGEPTYTWRTTRHTADPVPLFASGPGTSPLADTLPIAEVGQLLLGLVRE